MACHQLVETTGEVCSHVSSLRGLQVAAGGEDCTGICSMGSLLPRLGQCTKRTVISDDGSTSQLVWSFLICCSNLFYKMNTGAGVLDPRVKGSDRAQVRKKGSSLFNEYASLTV